MKAKRMSFYAYFKRYGLLGFIRLCRDCLLTRTLFPGARIIRYPFYIRGGRCIDVGKGFTAGVGLRLDAFPEKDQTVIHFGSNVEVNDYVHIGAIQKVKIGDNVLIASKVYISDHNHGNYSAENQSMPETIVAERALFAKEVEIEDNVWIGEGVAILPGVKIGRGAIVGANSVVTRSVPPESIVAGNPAKVIKVFNREIGKWEVVKSL